MKNIFKSASILGLSILMLSQTAFSQGISKKREYSGFFDSFYYRGPLSITIGGGATLFKGDVVKSFYGSPGMDVNLGLNYKIWPRVLFGVEFNYLTLAGKTGDSTGLSFTGKDLGFNVYARYYLIDDIVRKGKDRKIVHKTKPYIMAGAGFLKYNATASTGISTSGTTPAFPVGFGIEFKLSPKFQLLTEINHTFTLNDQLDASAAKKGADGFSMARLTIQFSPFAPKKKQKFTTSPAEPNQNREEHQEWRIKKKEAPAPVHEYGEDEEDENTNDEENTEEEYNEDAPSEEEEEDSWD